MSNRARTVWAPLTATIVACGLLVIFATAAVGAPLRGGANLHGFGFGDPLGLAASGPTARLDPFGSPFGSSSVGSALVGSAPTGAGPSAIAEDPATHTIYVTNGYNENEPNAGGDTLSVIDARHCQAQSVSACKGPWPTIKVGNLPSSVVVDQATDTVYVSNYGDNTVSVFNGATCNAMNKSGCGQTPATVPVGEEPVGLYLDSANHTVYVPEPDNGAGDSSLVSMLNSATCTAADLAGCPTTQPPTFDAGAAPFDAAVDQATHTLYIGTNVATSVLDADTCNATDQAGCGTIGTLPGGPAGGPNTFGFDNANHTLYTADYANTISAFNLRDCNASDLTGCAADTPGTVAPFPYDYNNDAALSVVVDVALHSVYVSFQRDDALLVVDTNVCNANNPAGCTSFIPRAAATGAQPEGLILDPQTQSLYAANATDNDVSVIDATRCNAQVTSGCREVPPTVAFGPGAQGLATDAAVNTLYAATPEANAVSMVNTRTCNSATANGCAAIPAELSDADNPEAVAVDPVTHTVYVSNYGTSSTGTVSVIDSDTCNATDSAGCGSVQTLNVPGGNPDEIEVNTATDTVYVATDTASGANVLSVFNGVTCNATQTSGCSQTPTTLALGDSVAADPGFVAASPRLAIDQATNTIYATNVGYEDDNFVGDSVYVFNGATCDAAKTSGCGQTPAVITPENPLTPGGVIPWGVAIDDATDTIYVGLQASGDYAGSVAVINGAICNGTNSVGCDQTPTIVAAGWGSSEVGIDPTTGTVYTTNTEDESLSVISGTTCNRFVTFGCGGTPPRVAAGSYPGFSSGTIAVDPAAGTIYVTNEAGVSAIPLQH
jgi:DNA-binding beta-propeller fold protein YncE